MLDIKITRGENFPKQIITGVSYTPDGKDIDEIVYYLICAAEKMNNESKVEQSLALPRLQRAFHDLRKLIRKVEKEENEEFEARIAAGK